MALTSGVLAYDIADDRRRARVHRLLEEYGVPVQESVFFFQLAPTGWLELERRLLGLVSRREDDVRVWPLCRSCLGRAKTWCGVPREVAGPVAIV